MGYKVKIKNKNFIGMSHGLKFEGGVSEIFDSEELYLRMLSKGYESVDVEAEEKALRAAEEKTKAKAEAEIQKRIDAAVDEALKNAEVSKNKK